MTLGINTLLLSSGALGSFTCSGMTLPIYMGPRALHGFRATGDTLSNVESQVFTPYYFGSSRHRTPDRLTTRPTGYHSATALNTWNIAGILYLLLVQYYYGALLLNLIRQNVDIEMSEKFQVEPRGCVIRMLYIYKRYFPITYKFTPS